MPEFSHTTSSSASSLPSAAAAAALHHAARGIGTWRKDRTAMNNQHCTELPGDRLPSPVEEAAVGLGGQRVDDAQQMVGCFRRRVDLQSSC